MRQEVDDDQLDGYSWTLDSAWILTNAGHRLYSETWVWERQRDALAAEVTVRGFDTSRSAYTRSYGSHDVDAALLILPLLGIDDGGRERDLLRDC